MTPHATEKTTSSPQLKKPHISGTTPHHLATTEAAEPTPAQTADQSIIIIRDFQPGRLVRVVFLTVEQAKQLPTIHPDALQLAVGLQLSLLH